MECVLASAVSASPPKPQADLSGPTSVLLSWDEPDDHGTPITHVSIQVIPAVGKPSEIEDLPIDERHEVTGLSPGMAYTFRVKSRNSVGYGGFSVESDPVTTTGGGDDDILFIILTSPNESINNPLTVVASMHSVGSLSFAVSRCCRMQRHICHVRLGASQFLWRKYHPHRIRHPATPTIHRGWAAGDTRMLDIHCDRTYAWRCLHNARQVQE